MIKDKTVVSINYVLKNSKGEELDKSDEKNPLIYLHGTQQIVPGLEKELGGLKVGDKKNVSVPPDQGYGEIDTKLHIKTERSFFPSPKRSNSKFTMIEIGPGWILVRSGAWRCTTKAQWRHRIGRERHLKQFPL